MAQQTLVEEGAFHRGIRTKINENFSELYNRNMVAEVSLTPAQVLALNATPIQVIAAPGNGALFIDIKAWHLSKGAGTAYAGIDAAEDMVLRYTDASGAIAATAEMTGFADQATSVCCKGAINACFPAVNAAVVVHMLNGEITTGNSLIRLRVEYQLLPFPVNNIT